MSSQATAASANKAPFLNNVDETVSDGSGTARGQVPSYWYLNRLPLPLSGFPIHANHGKKFKMWARNHFREIFSETF